MITEKNLEDVLKLLGYIRNSKRKMYVKHYPEFDCAIKVDFSKKEIIYPEEKGMLITRKTTCNFSEPENFVVLECITRLMNKGYRPEHIELEKEWSLGHNRKSGFADICVKDEEGKTLFIVECKTFGKEYQKEHNNMLTDGGQLFSYWQQEGSSKWLILYSSDLIGKNIEYTTDSVDCSDDNNILTSAAKDSTIKLYKDAHTAEELFEVWDETYEKRFCGDVVFRDDTQAYQIGVKPLRKKDLKDFSENDKVVNKFEEILRHNNVSDKENAFNRLIALFICKLVDEIQKGDDDVVEFQYKIGTDTYESLQDRLQRLHKEGMEKFMREEIFYVSDNYAEDLVQQYTGHKRQKMIDDLKRTLRILKFYTNNDFAFKNVHNEELFYQNGKIIVEVVQLFENYRIIGSSDVQMLGDLFEQLLNKGFKQNEGQFFTPIPITRFIWDSLPLDKIVCKDDATEYPKIIDYACGAGHFLTQGFESVNDCVKRNDPSVEIPCSWVENKVYGIEKDYRLARVSKISLFMHGAGDGNIIFGDGLENYKDKSIVPNTFDILVANPPYSVSAFKPHLKLKNNEFTILSKISNNGSEIETLFVERISQLVKPDGIAAVVLPSSILNKENESFIAARESVLTNFYIRAIAQLGSKTFSATGTNTVILFLQKFKEPPKRIDLVSDSVQAIFEGRSLDDWEDKEILEGYISQIGLTMDIYKEFINQEWDYTKWYDVPYFAQYVSAFIGSSEVQLKEKQKAFSKCTVSEKMKWYNKHFYKYAVEKETEKMKYFALCYRQVTLVISAPDDNKEQEKFLGYKWSNRKGQEGIQIIEAGGMLYNEQDRTDNSTIAGIIRNNFEEKQLLVSDLSEYYYYLRLQDMLDFSGVDFYKSIKIVKKRDTGIKKGMTAYKLNDPIFDIGIGNRVLSTEIVGNGQYPVYSANVFEEFGRINKQNITDFSLPSIIWGIDGDWMVNYIPANYPFYPTDHCGVLRINSDSIIPKYMAIALKIEGEYEKFSRSNRASVQRIKSLTIQLPKKKVQQKVVDEIDAIDRKIRREEMVISDLTDEVRSKFVEMFGNITQMITIGECCFVEKGATLTREQAVEGDVPVVAGGMVPSCYHNEANRPANVITISASGANAGFVNYWNIPIFATDCNTIQSIDNSQYSAEYIYYALLNIQDEIYRLQKGAGQPHVYGKDIEKLKIPVPDSKQQNIFADYVRSINKLKSEANESKFEYESERIAIINKYFK